MSSETRLDAASAVAYTIGSRSVQMLKDRTFILEIPEEPLDVQCVDEDILEDEDTKVVVTHTQDTFDNQVTKPNLL